jgi:hypothetical protein
MSTFPQFTCAWVESSRRRGVADAGQQLLLPQESAVKLGESLALIAAAGSEFGNASADQQRALLYLGVQVLR